MRSITIALIAFACIFGGTLLGMFFRGLLPEHHLSHDSKDVMKLGIGMVATMAALALGLLVGSAKGSLDTLHKGLMQTGSKIIMLDRTMALYGPETKESRAILRGDVTDVIKRIWPEKKNIVAASKMGNLKIGIEVLEEKLRQLSPRDDDQRQLQSRAIQINSEIAEARWLLIEQVGQSSFPIPFLVLLVCWLTIIFFSFGLFSSPNTTVIAVLFVCALSAASSLFLILELDQPYGFIKLSSDPLLKALAHLGQ